MSEAAPAPKKGRTTSFSCPGCGSPVDIRASGISISAICPACGRTIDVADEKLAIIAEAQANTRTPAIAIGARATLAGTEWQVVGYQARSNPDEGWSWEEYLLFNPYRGFRFLAADDEGWTLYCMLRQDVPDPARVHDDPRRYDGPETSPARTDYVLGEFYWRVRVGDTASVETYTADPYSLTKEVTGDEIVWSRGLKLNTPEVRAAFKLDPPAVAGAGVVRPKQRSRTMAIWRVWFVAMVLLVLLSIVGFGRSRSLVVFHQDYTVTLADRGHPIASEPFTVPDQGGNLRFDLHATVTNNWAELGLSLVPAAGGTPYQAGRTIEYYTGVDSDGSWEEGGRDARVMFASVPGGQYRLLVDVDAGVFGDTNRAPPRLVQGVLSTAPATTPKLDFSIEGVRHAPAPELFWIALLLLLPYPLYRLFFKRGSAT